MSRALAMRRIILPQAMRVIIPPTGNQFISLLKATSLVWVIAGGDLLAAAENISSANLQTIALMLVATFWYLVLTSRQRRPIPLERRSRAPGRGHAAALMMPPAPAGARADGARRRRAQALRPRRSAEGHRPDVAAGEVSA